MRRVSIDVSLKYNNMPIRLIRQHGNQTSFTEEKKKIAVFPPAALQRSQTTAQLFVLTSCTVIPSSDAKDWSKVTRRPGWRTPREAAHAPPMERPCPPTHVKFRACRGVILHTTVEAVRVLLI